jgi:hypothetical protein
MGGSTIAPPFNAVCQRAGWSIGLVQERYLRYDGAMDQYVGRVVSGLPLKKAEFAAVAPHFAPTAPEPLLNAAVAEYFDASVLAQPHMHSVALMCLASAVYHRAFLDANLDERSPVRQSALFTSRTWMALAEHLQPLDKPVINETGIPPHVLHFGRVKEIERGQAALEEAIASLPDKVVDGVDRVLEQRAVQQGNITAASLNETVAAVVKGVLTEAGLGGGSERPGAEEAGSAPPPPSLPTVYQWGGRLRRVSEDWRPNAKVNLRTGWRLWWKGDSVAPPYRILSGHDYHKDAARTMSEYRAVFRGLERYLSERDHLERDPDDGAVSRMFDKAIPCAAERGIKRRPETVHVNSAARKFRKTISSDCTSENSSQQ